MGLNTNTSGGAARRASAGLVIRAHPAEVAGAEGWRRAIRPSCSAALVVVVAVVPLCQTGSNSHAHRATKTNRPARRYTVKRPPPLDCLIGSHYVRAIIIIQGFFTGASLSLSLPPSYRSPALSLHLARSRIYIRGRLRASECTRSMRGRERRYEGKLKESEREDASTR